MTVQMPNPHQPTLDEVLLGQVREAFGRLVYSHKTHEKQADLCFRRHQQQATALVVLTALSTGTFLGALLGWWVNTRITALVTAFLALLVSGLNLATSRFKFEERSREHRDTATRLWDVRESYLSLITDMMSGSLTDEQARTRRDELQEQTRKVYAESPRTTDKAFTQARAGIKDNEEMTFTSHEIDLLLPHALRLGEDLP